MVSRSQRGASSNFNEVFALSDEWHRKGTEATYRFKFYLRHILGEQGVPFSRADRGSSTIMTLKRGLTHIFEKK
jgi:hypothetical protein